MDDTRTQEILVYLSMIGTNAFCPKTGAPLSDNKHYDDQGHGRRAVLFDDGVEATSSVSELTNGAIRSTKVAVFNHFRRCHQRHHEPDDALYRKASLAFTRLKRVANGKQGWDIHLWYAAKVRLQKAGYDTAWMHAHTTPRCPHCHGRLKYRDCIDGQLIARCGTTCTNTTTDQLTEIRELLADLYAQAFPDANNAIDADSFL